MTHEQQRSGHPHKTLEQQRAAHAPHVAPEMYFKLFVAEQLLKRMVVVNF
jgi:hypothetical protein